MKTSKHRQPPSSAKNQNSKPALPAAQPTEHTLRQAISTPSLRSREELNPSAVVLEPKIRVAKAIASTHRYSRRKAEELITNRAIEVNGVLITTPAYFVQPQDIIKVAGETITWRPPSNRETPGVYLFYKPKGCLTTKTDPLGRKTVYNILPKPLRKLLYVGRLDCNSEGLLLFTSCGNLANQLTLAKNKVLKIYRVKTFGRITQQALDKLYPVTTIQGISYRNVKARLESQNHNQSWIVFELHEGKNNEIRNICRHLGLKVRKLVRTKFGPFHVGKLTPGEVIKLQPSVVKKLLSTLKE